MKPDVFVFSRLSDEHLAELKARYNVTVLDPKGDIEAQYAKALPTAKGMIGVGRKLGPTQLAQAKNLKVISSISVGYDNYDLPYLTKRGIMLTNTPDVLTETTADLGFTLLMSAARRVPELDAWTKNGNWQRTLSPDLFGVDIHHKTLGIVGMGRIGAAIARRGHFGFNMPVLYTANSPKPELEAELNARYCLLDTLLAQADFVVLVVPLGPQTRQLIGKAQLAQMKADAILINVARGAVVDEAALIESLQTQQIRAAGLDVYEREPLAESPLFALPNVVTLPHIGSATAQTRNAMARLAMDNFHQAMAGEKPQSLVNTELWS
ncbi:2-hydroxyacid dehydrogenase [Gallaecimonas mangrovi]|uniref:2-hydroxyacid dehydrogenase n=1 Tax=Gallaecimonas mangrovi TaxID=2291597 RepID=UPI000E20A867|nr:D-glycerate dehydrogenase [Gallaecimonas mangrovi]